MSLVVIIVFNCEFVLEICFLVLFIDFVCFARMLKERSSVNSLFDPYLNINDVTSDTSFKDRIFLFFLGQGIVREERTLEFYDGKFTTLWIQWLCGELAQLRRPSSKASPAPPSSPLVAVCLPVFTLFFYLSLSFGKWFGSISKRN